MAIVNAGQGEPSQWVRAATSAATTTTSPKPNSASLPSREKRMGGNGVRLKPDPQETQPDFGSGCGGRRRRLLFESELLHAPIKRLSTQPQLARRARDDAAGTCQSTFDLCAVGLALGNHLQRSRRHHQAEVGGRNL